MNIEIKTDQLISYGLTIEQYLLCMFLYRGLNEESKTYYKTFGTIDRGLIDILFDRKILRSVSINSYSIDNLRINEENFLKLLKIEPVSSWMEKWFNLWPKGIKSGGYYVKTDSHGCKTKLIKFIKNNPQYTKDIIMEATERYLFTKSLDGYDYTSLAPNFIEKNGVSMLAGECENVLNNISTPKPEIVQGELFGGNEL